MKLESCILAMKELDSIPNKLKSLYCLIKPIYKSSSANRKFNCKCENCKKWNTLRNFYRKNTNPEYNKKQLESSKKWRKANPEAKRRSEAKRRALKLGNGHSAYTEKQVLNIYGQNCFICNSQINLEAVRTVGIGNWKYGLHIDHLIPISKGGTDTIENVRPTHAICNIRKGAA